MTDYKVSSTGDNSDGLTWATAFTTIDAGLTAAIASDSITVDDGTFSGAGNTGLTISAAITLQSRNGSGSTTIDCGGTSNFLTIGNFDTTGLIIDGFNIYNGSNGSGGGIDSAGFSGEPTIKNCIFDTCAATVSHGGGIRVEASDFIVSRCKFISCTSATGTGGINHHGNGGRMHVEYCIFDSCSGAYGGGVGWFGTAASAHEVYNCSFYNCSSGSAPNNGAIWGSGSDCDTINCAADTCGSDPWAQGVQAGNTAQYSIAAYALAGTGNINDSPNFVNAAGGDFSLNPDTSQAIDNASNAVWSGTPNIVDYNDNNITDGTGTIVAYGGTVDMGALEYSPSASGGGGLMFNISTASTFYNK